MSLLRAWRFRGLSGRLGSHLVVELLLYPDLCLCLCLFLFLFLVL